MANKRTDPDKIMLGAAVIYAVLPVILFMFGWLHFILALLFSGVIGYMAYRVIRDLPGDNKVSIKDNPRFWLISFIVIFMWVLFSGIGKFSRQSSDFVVRNAVYRDLIWFKWPVVYDMSFQPEVVASYTNNAAHSIFVYYFSWWLPPAALTKFCALFGGQPETVEKMGDTFLFLWAVIGIFLVYYCLVRLIEKYSYWILSVLVLFGGLDVIPFYIVNHKLPDADHIEWWASYFQYSSNTTQLMFVFNQSIPVWITVVLMLLLKKRGQKAAIASLSFAYSPFATLGMVPLAIASCFDFTHGKGSLKSSAREFLTVENIAVPAVMLIVYGSFYKMVTGSATENNGFQFERHPDNRTLTLYLTFLLIEVLIYYLVMGNRGKKYDLYWVTLGELILIPLYIVGNHNDFVMRSSIPALFVLMTFVLRFLLDEDTAKKSRIIMTVVVCIGFVTGFTDVETNIKLTLTRSQQDFVREDLFSIGMPMTEDESQLITDVDQMMSLDSQYETTFFYRFLMQDPMRG